MSNDTDDNVFQLNPHPSQKEIRVALTSTIDRMFNYTEAVTTYGELFAVSPLLNRIFMYLESGLLLLKDVNHDVVPVMKLGHTLGQIYHNLVDEYVPKKNYTGAQFMKDFFSELDEHDLYIAVPRERFDWIRKIASKA